MSRVPLGLRKLALATADEAIRPTTLVPVSTPERRSIVATIRSAAVAAVVVPARTAWRLVPSWIKHNWLTNTVVETVRLVRANRVMGIAAEVSFWGVLSVTPLLLVSASTLGWIDAIFGFDVADNARDQMTHFVRDLLGIGDQAVDAIDSLFDSPDPAGLTVGVITSIYASARGFVSLIGGIDHITGREKRRSWLTTRIAGFIAVLIAIPALVALLVMINVGRTGFGLPGPFDSIVAAALWPAIAVGLTGAALWLLHSAPAQKTPVLHDLLGAAVTVAIWFGGSWVATRYLSSFSDDVLGLLGGSVGLLFWLYIMTAGILIGAQVNVAVRPETTAPARVQSARANPVEEPVHANEPTGSADDPSEMPIAQ